MAVPLPKGGHYPWKENPKGPRKDVQRRDFEEAQKRAYRYEQECRD
jgi:hypothetical protein